MFISLYDSLFVAATCTKEIGEIAKITSKSSFYELQSEVFFVHRVYKNRA